MEKKDRGEGLEKGLEILGRRTDFCGIARNGRGLQGETNGLSKCKEDVAEAGNLGG